jgi:RNA polymerase sigma-70 factor (ECF subfamily)
MHDRDLERIYDTHASGLYRYLLTFTRAEPDARDLLQDLFIKLAQSPPTEVRNEKSFLYRLAHNLAIDWLRRRATRQQSETALLAHLNGHTHSTPDPDTRALAQTFADALLKLPDEQRTILHLKLWEGLTFEQIAETQAIPLNTAASRYRYGLDKLRALLRPIYEELQ